MYIEKETIELTGAALLASFVGWLLWQAVFYLANHISIEWVS